MKFLLISLLILFTSCASVKYSAVGKNNDFSEVKTGKTYVIFGENNFRKRLKVNAIEENFLITTDMDGQTIQLKKSEITKIRKNNTGATVAVSFLGASCGLALTGFIIFSQSFNMNW